MKRVAASVLIVAALVVPAGAERLAISAYTTADGLGSSWVQAVVTDPRGFVWLATRDGLSRFDGLTFRTYTTADGLAHPVVNHLLVTSDGEYWIATNGGGVCRFNVAPEGRANRPGGAAGDPATPLFTCRLLDRDNLSNRVNVLYEDRQHRIWAATDNGLFRLIERGGDWRLHRAPLEAVPAHVTIVRRIHEDTNGRLWIGFTGGLLRQDPDGRARFYTVRSYPRAAVTTIAEHGNRLWVGFAFGLLALRPDETLTSRSDTQVLNPERTCAGRGGAGLSLPASEGETCLVDDRVGLPHRHIHRVYPAATGRLWIGTNGGLAYLEGARLDRFAAAEHLAGATISALAEDHDGHLWIGTTTGALRLALNGLVSYGPRDGLGHPRVHLILEDSSGTVFVVSGDWIVNRYDAGRFRAIRLRIPRGAGAGYRSQHAFLDSAARWWLLSTRGLSRLRPAATIALATAARPEVMYTTRDGLPDDNVVRLFEDSRGDVWIATYSPAETNLSRLRRATGEISRIRGGLPGDVPLSFAEDRNGAVWIGFEHGGLARYHNDEFRLFTAADGAPRGLIALHIDLSGRLWAASTSAGASVIQDVGASRPRFTYYTTAQGLSTDGIRCLTEDTSGRIYLGTARGVDRLDPATGRVRRITTKDGLAGDYVTAAYRDRAGTLWFGTMDGVSRLVPGPAAPATAPSVWIAEVRVAGALHPTSEIGERELSGLELGPTENHLQIGFVAIGSGTGGELGYRYRLEGTEDAWTAPTDRRVVHYASLSPGRYRFAVEALNADGVASRQPATVSFTVLAPVWRRWWFVSLAVTVAAVVMYAAYRYRLARLLELERIRTRIASDLHDDIGANLSQIAIMSEVARQRLAGDGSPLIEPLSAIAVSSRESLDAMSDIVWAVNPKRDTLSELAHRMRRFASDVLSARDIRFTFPAPDGPELVVDAHVRRDVLLMFKESINNVARHSGCRETRIALAHEGGLLHLRIEDDGRGFESAGTGGLGLESIRRRAEKLGGELAVSSSPGQGTHVTVRVPIERPRRLVRFRLPAWVVTKMGPKV